MGEWFYGMYVGILKVILASQDATEVLSTTVTKTLLFKPEVVIGILQVFSGSITFTF